MQPPRIRGFALTFSACFNYFTKTLHTSYDYDNKPFELNSRKIIHPVTADKQEYRPPQELNKCKVKKK